jgi:protein-S-isoprenylcysteine O-methyltransferase Ste14
MLIYLLKTAAWTVLLMLLIFAPAGTLAYPGGWALLIVFTLGSVAAIAWLARANPALLAERMGSPVQKGQPLWDRIWLGGFAVFFCAWVAFMAWDAAQGEFRAMPVWLQAAGLAGMFAYGFGVWRTFGENTFAAPVVKVQDGQSVIDTGPYARVRHPMYACALLLSLSMPLVLGSWRGFAGTAVLVAILAWRTLREERVLRRDLPGYTAYAERVRFRWIPNLW